MSACLLQKLKLFHSRLVYRVDRCHLPSSRALLDLHGDLVTQTRSWRVQVLVEQATAVESCMVSALEDGAVTDGHEDLVVIG